MLIHFLTRNQKQNVKLNLSSQKLLVASGVLYTFLNWLVLLANFLEPRFKNVIVIHLFTCYIFIFLNKSFSHLSFIIFIFPQKSMYVISHTYKERGKQMRGVE